MKILDDGLGGVGSFIINFSVSRDELRDKSCYVDVIFYTGDALTIADVDDFFLEKEWRVDPKGKNTRCYKSPNGIIIRCDVGPKGRRYYKVVLQEVLERLLGVEL